MAGFLAVVVAVLATDGVVVDFVGFAAEEDVVDRAVVVVPADVRAVLVVVAGLAGVAREAAVVVAVARFGAAVVELGVMVDRRSVVVVRGAVRDDVVLDDSVERRREELSAPGRFASSPEVSEPCSASDVDLVEAAPRRTALPAIGRVGGFDRLLPRVEREDVVVPAVVVVPGRRGAALVVAGRLGGTFSRFEVLIADLVTVFSGVASWDLGSSAGAASARPSSEASLAWTGSSWTSASGVCCSSTSAMMWTGIGRS